MDQVTFILNRAKQAILSRDFEFAEKILTSLKTKNIAGEENKDVLTLLGDLYLKSENFDKALTVFEKLHSIDPSDIGTLNNLGIIYRRLRQYEKSISVLQQARAAGDNSSTLLYNLGNTYKEMHSYDEAAMCFMEVLEMDPSDVLAYNHLGTIEILNTNYDKAIQAYKHGLQRDSNHPFIHFNLARLYRMLEKNDDAEKEYIAAIKNRPAWLQALKELASLYDITGETDRRKETLGKILSISPKDVSSLIDYAQIERKQENYENAKKFFGLAVNAAGSDMKPSVLFSDFLRSMGKNTEAVSVLEKFNRNYPGSMEVMLGLSELYLILLQYPKVREIFNECDKIDENNLKLLSLKSKLYVALGDQQRARAYLAKILNIAPGQVEFRLEFAEQLAETGLLPEAEEQLAAYLEEKPEDYGARILLGAIYEQMKNFEKAAACYSAVIAAEKENIQANSALSLLYQRTGKTAEAVRLADEIVNLQGGRANEHDMSSLEESISLYEQAVNHYKIANPEIASRNISLLQPPEIPEEKEEKAGEKPDGHPETSGNKPEEDDAVLNIEDDEAALEKELYDEGLDHSLDDMKDFGESVEPENPDTLENNPFLEELPESFDSRDPEQDEDSGEILLQDEETGKTPEPDFPRYPPLKVFPGGNDATDGIQDEAADFNPEEALCFAKPEPLSGTGEFFQADDTDISFDSYTGSMYRNGSHACRTDLGPMPPFGFPMRSPVLDSPELEKVLEKIPGKNLLELLKYIRKITEFLPENLFSSYLMSEERLILEYMIYKLSGNPGIRYNNLAKSVYQEAKAKGLLKEHHTDENMLGQTFSFLESLVSELPDKGFSSLLKRRIDEIKTSIESHGDSRGSSSEGSQPDNPGMG